MEYEGEEEVPASTIKMQGRDLILPDGKRIGHFTSEIAAWGAFSGALHPARKAYRSPAPRDIELEESIPSYSEDELWKVDKS